MSIADMFGRAYIQTDRVREHRSTKRLTQARTAAVLRNC